MAKMQSLDEKELTAEQRLDKMRNFLDVTFIEMQTRGAEFKQLASPKFQPLWSEFNETAQKYKQSKFHLFGLVELVVTVGDLINMEAEDAAGSRAEGGSPQATGSDSGAGSTSTEHTEVVCAEDIPDGHLTIKKTSDPKVVVNEWLDALKKQEVEPSFHLVQASVGKEIMVRELTKPEPKTRLVTYRVQFNADHTKAVLTHAT